MNKKIRLIAFIAFISISFYAVQRSQYEQFYPVIYSVEYGELVIDDVHTPYQFYENLEKVLKFYEHDYKKKDSVIYVKKSLYKDLDLCWNYTSKAQNKVWLNNHNF